MKSKVFVPKADGQRVTERFRRDRTWERVQIHEVKAGDLIRFFNLDWTPVEYDKQKLFYAKEDGFLQEDGTGAVVIDLDQVPDV